MQRHAETAVVEIAARKGDIDLQGAVSAQHFEQARCARFGLSGRDEAVEGRLRHPRLIEWKNPVGAIGPLAPTQHPIEVEADTAQFFEDRVRGSVLRSSPAIGRPGNKTVGHVEPCPATSRWASSSVMGAALGFGFPTSLSVRQVTFRLSRMTTTRRRSGRSKKWRLKGLITSYLLNHHRMRNCSRRHMRSCNCSSSSN